MVFVRSVLIAALVLASVVVVGCSRFLEIELFNNTNETVTAQPTSEKAIVSPGQSKEFRYPGDNENWMLILATKSCDYVYPVPRTFENYPRPDYSGPFKVQLEKDFVLYLLPNEATAVVNAQDLGPVQKGVFPLRPSSKTCR